MKTIAIRFLCAAAVASAAAKASFPVQGEEGPQPKAMGDRTYYSRTLRAEFTIQRMWIPGYVFYAARIVSPPEPDLPLRQLGCEIGDVITRLDGPPLRGMLSWTGTMARRLYATSSRIPSECETALST